MLIIYTIQYQRFGNVQNKEQAFEILSQKIGRILYRFEVLKFTENLTKQVIYK